MWNRPLCWDPVSLLLLPMLPPQQAGWLDQPSCYSPLQVDAPICGVLYITFYSFTRCFHTKGYTSLKNGKVRRSLVVKGLARGLDCDINMLTLGFEPAIFRSRRPYALSHILPPRADPPGGHSSTQVTLETKRHLGDAAVLPWRPAFASEGVR